MSEFFYQQRRQQFNESARGVRTQIVTNAWLRVLVILLMGGAIYLGFQYALWFWSTLPFLLVFFFLVQRQARLEHRQAHLVRLAQLNALEAAAVDFSFNDFPDGAAYHDVRHPYAHDLDVFGRGSLFQYINRCATVRGEARLAHDLKTLPYDAVQLQQRQEAVKELAPLTDFRQNVWATGRSMNESEFRWQPLTEWLDAAPLVMGRPVLTVLRWLLPVVALVIIALVIIDSAFFPWLFAIMAVQLSITGFFGKRIDRMQHTLAGGKEILERYARIFALLQQQKVESALLLQHHAFACAASDAVKAFSALASALESRMNALARLFGNGLFMFDFHTVSRLERWRAQHAEHFEQWMQSLAEWDALLSLATLHFNHPQYEFATYTEGLQLDLVEAGHPLIPGQERVYNTVALGKPATVMLVTGANMAGKSTFLRTVGVNVLLARVGAPACATAMVCPMVPLRTGMRTSDSLQEHQSYFFAELHRLQTIVQELQRGEPLLLLLDEILKGTNSTDKQLGSRELIKQMIHFPALVLLATHDIALGDMEQQYPTRIENACFEGDINDGKLTFSYKLRPGVAQKANATFLMRQMGIIPS